MKYIFAWGILLYHLFGTLCLPMGDFSMLTDLPKMYHHCKSTEDKDMTVVDFFTDHLVDFDALFDPHENDEQKPHQSNSFSHSAHQVIFISPSIGNNFNSDFCIELPLIGMNSKFVPTDFYDGIFRPPIV